MRAALHFDAVIIVPQRIIGARHSATVLLVGPRRRRQYTVEETASALLCISSHFINTLLLILLFQCAHCLGEVVKCFGCAKSNKSRDPHRFP